MKENEEQNPSGESTESPRPALEEGEGLTARMFFSYLTGSYLIAAILNIGFGLIVGAGWKVVLGGTLILGLILFGITLTDQQKKQRTNTPKAADSKG